MTTLHTLLDTFDLDAFASLVKRVDVPFMRIAEVGCFEGGTSVWVSGNMGKPHCIYAIDIWEDSAVYGKLLKELLRNNAPISPIRLSSKEAIGLFEDKELDLVFIDADHTYSHVLEDIQGWMPKVKSGGILCGHDAEGKYTSYNGAQREEIDKHKEDDKTSFSCHAGVVKALYDVFHDGYDIYPKSRVWYKTVV